MLNSLLILHSFSSLSEWLLYQLKCWKIEDSLDKTWITSKSFYLNNDLNMRLLMFFELTLILCLWFVIWLFTDLRNFSEKPVIEDDWWSFQTTSGNCSHLINIGDGGEFLRYMRNSLEHNGNCRKYYSNI